jgi:hypothetical protein
VVELHNLEHSKKVEKMKKIYEPYDILLYKFTPKTKKKKEKIKLRGVTRLGF